MVKVPLYRVRISRALKNNRIIAIDGVLGRGKKFQFTNLEFRLIAKINFKLAFFLFTSLLRYEQIIGNYYNNYRKI